MYFKHELLKVWREELGLTQEQLGQLLNLKQNTISQWEAGQRMPDLLSIISLAKIHNKSVEQFLRKSQPFVTIEKVDTAIETGRDLPRLLTEHAWFTYVKEFRSKSEGAGEDFSSQTMQESLEAIRESASDPDQMLNLKNLPRSIYENICESMTYYVERCVEMMKRIEQIEALPDEDKKKQAIILNKMGRSSSLFKFDLVDPGTNAAKDLAVQTANKPEEKFAAAEDDLPYDE